MSKKFQVTLKKSLIACPPTQRLTIKGLGLRKINSSIELADNAANRGQLFKIQHMVEIKVVK
ncbi:50S ribosomal protein L30 [Bdellovibrio sp. qaytius]|nr:50S ribosomal protein L30 [Bdellovibrio sp. qaytius]